MGVLISRVASYLGVCLQAYGGFIMSASHNPGGPKYDWGIKVSRTKRIRESKAESQLKVEIVFFFECPW